MSKRWAPAGYDDWLCTDPDAEADEVADDPCKNCGGYGGWRGLVGTVESRGATTWYDCDACKGTGSATDCEDEP